MDGEQEAAAARSRDPHGSEPVGPSTQAALLPGSAAGLKAFYRAHLAPPTAYCVEFQRSLSGDEFETLDRQVRNMPEAASWGRQVGDPDWEIVIYFREGITDADRVRLEARVQALPDVGRIERCRFP